MITLHESNLWREIHEQPNCVRTCLEKNKDFLQEIAKDVKARNITTVVFAARGSSDHAAQVARYLFEVHCEMIVSISAPSVITCYDGNVNYHNTLVIGISQSGGAQDVAAVMKKSIEQGALCVSITNERNSLMAKIGHYSLNNECGEETSITAAKSYLTQLVLLSALTAYVSEDPTLLGTLEHVEDIISYALTLEDQVRKLLPMYRNCDHLLLFGRGLLYGLAQESELKIQETCYLDARSYAASDYQHGPIASTNTFTPAIFFIADKQSNKSISLLLQRMKDEHNVATTIITNDETIFLKGDNGILFQAKYDGLASVFVCAVISQMFACLLAISRGYNPDNPIGVSKHTVTI